MTTYDRGDIVLVPFPFSDEPGVSKQRPAVVVSSDEYSSASDEYVLAQITSRVGGISRPGDYLVESWQDAGLLAPSLVRAKLMTLHRNLIARKFGTMNHTDLIAVSSALGSALDLMKAN